MLVAGDGTFGGYLDEAAGVLEERFEGIFAAYEERLARAKSPLVAEHATREQLKAQARRVLEDAARDLRRGPPANGSQGPEAPRGDKDGLSAAIGASRARGGVHPIESIKAVVALFEAALSAVVGEIEERGAPRRENPAREVAAVALALQKSIMGRVTEASVAYGYYLLNRARRSEDDERRRVSRELHDRVAHSIMVAYRNLELYEMYESEDPQKARAKLDLAKRAAQEALGATRDLSHELRASSAEEGLEAALSDHLRANAPGGVEVRVTAEGDESLIAPEVRDELFLVLREALRNALAHSGARSVTVELSTTRDRFEAAVEDDGRGFELTAETPMVVRTPAGPPSGTGLASMRERTALLGGTVKMRSLRGQGTRIDFSVPLPGPLPGGGRG